MNNFWLSFAFHMAYDPSPSPGERLLPWSPETHPDRCNRTEHKKENMFRPFLAFRRAARQHGILRRETSSIRKSSGERELRNLGTEIESSEVCAATFGFQFEQITSESRAAFPARLSAMLRRFKVASENST